MRFEVKIVRLIDKYGTFNRHGNYLKHQSMDEVANTFFVIINWPLIGCSELKIYVLCYFVFNLCKALRIE